MSKHLERDLEDLHRDILELAGAVEVAIYRAIRALQERDADTTGRVVERTSSRPGA